MVSGLSGDQTGKGARPSRPRAVWREMRMMEMDGWKSRRTRLEA